MSDKETQEPSPPSTDLAREAGKKCALQVVPWLTAKNDRTNPGRAPALDEVFERIISEVIAPLEAELAKYKIDSQAADIYADDLAKSEERAEAAERKLAEHAEAELQLLGAAEIVCNWIDDDSVDCHQAHAKLRTAIERLRKLREGLVPITDSPSTRGGKDGIEAAPLLEKPAEQSR